MFRSDPWRTGCETQSGLESDLGQKDPLRRFLMLDSDCLSSALIEQDFTFFLLVDFLEFISSCVYRFQIRCCYIIFKTGQYHVYAYASLESSPHSGS